MQNLTFAHKTRLAGWKTCRILLEPWPSLRWPCVKSFIQQLPAALLLMPLRSMQSPGPGLGWVNILRGATSSALPGTRR